ncbi:hypothetical protein [uncultured Nostoc sp.]
MKKQQVFWKLELIALLMSTIFPQANGLYWRDITGGCEQDDSSQ